MYCFDSYYYYHYFFEYSHILCIYITLYRHILQAKKYSYDEITIINRVVFIYFFFPPALLRMYG